MREFLLQYMGEDAAMGVQFLVALLTVLILFGIFIWFLRLITGTSKRTRKVMSDQRLAILDRTQIDETRSLLLVRRDEVEHLVMVGGPTDVVVEANINLDEDDAFDTFAEPQPGHEIARRVIAQRPLRTMSLASSSPSVAESIGLGASSRPDATIAPPPPPLPTHEVAEEPAPAPVAAAAVPLAAVAEQVQPLQPAQAAEIPAVEVPPQPVAAVVQPAEPTPVPVAAVPETVFAEPTAVETEAVSQAAPTPVIEPVAQPQLVDNIAPTHITPAPAPVAPAPVVPTPEPALEPEIQAQVQTPQAVQMPDLAAQLEDALNLELGQDTNPRQSTSHNVESSAIEDRNIPPKPISTGETTMDDQERYQSQDADLSAGFAAAMGLDIAAEPVSAPRAQPASGVISEVALEDAIADMLRADGPVDTSTYNNGKNDVYSSPESVPSGSERLVDTTRPGRVDDEMSRLLQELAVPGRA